MSRISALSNSLFAFSLISFVVLSLIPDKSAGKKLIRTVAGLISILIIISTFTGIFDPAGSTPSTDGHNEHTESVEDYIIRKESEALAVDLKGIAGPILSEYGIKDARISVFTDKSDGQGISISKAVFYIQEDIDHVELEKRLSDKAGVKCEVVRENDR